MIPNNFQAVPKFEIAYANYSPEKLQIILETFHSTLREKNQRYIARNFVVFKKREDKNT